MNIMPWRVPVITASTIIASGLLWLIVYSLNARAGIGFDGPAGGILALTILSGWIIGGVAALMFSRPLSKNKLDESILAIMVTGLVISFATGFTISQYALSRYPDGGKYFQTRE